MFEFPRLALGTVRFGRDPRAQLPSNQLLEELIDTAQNLNMNFVDTAPAYGCSEERLGKLLLSRRKKWLISTKVGEEFENGVSYYDLSAKHTRMSVERSLCRLKTDYLDIVLVHCDANDEVLECLYKLKRAGWIRHVGVSAQTVAGAWWALPKVDVLMLTYNLFDKSQEEVLREARRMNKYVMIKKPLAKGLLNPKEALSFLQRELASETVVLGTLSQRHFVEAANLINLSFA